MTFGKEHMPFTVSSDRVAPFRPGVMVGVLCFRWPVLLVGGGVFGDRQLFLVSE